MRIRYIFFQFESESKGRTLAVLWLEIYITGELVHNLLWDHKAQTNSVLVELLGVLYEAKELKQLFLVLFFDANPRVFDWQFEIPLLSNDLYLSHDGDMALRCKLQRVRLQP